MSGIAGGDLVAGTNSAEVDELLRGLEGRQPARLSEHSGLCCRAAQGWLRATARTAAALFGPEPYWIGRRWRWGPTVWPLHWCEAVEQPDLDCGALAKLAAVAWQVTGAGIWRVQLLEQAAPEQIELWRARWAASPGAPEWIWGEWFYHEVVGIGNEESELRLWDPTTGGWRALSQDSSSRRILALRVAPASGACSASPTAPTPPDLKLPAGEWIRVAPADPLT